MTTRPYVPRLTLLLLFPLLAATAAALPAQTPPRTDRFEPVRAEIRRVMEENQIPSIAVAVAKDGRIVWEEGFGLADRERQLPATAHTPYSLASISKPMTATALMRLVEQGRIELDRPANDYLGEGRITGLAGEAAGATVRRVLSHTAGLPLHYEFFYLGEDHPRRTTDEGIARYAILVNPPGEAYEYSNLGYGILDRVIERVSGRSYEEFMQSEVFAPLGMTRSFVGTEAARTEGAAVRYDARLQPIPFYDFDHRGGSAVFASAHDLVRFGMFHLKTRMARQQRILRDATLEEMQRRATPATSPDAYGLGWLLDENDHGYRRVFHTGSMPGVVTVLNLYPTEKLAVVVLLNKLDRQARDRIARAIAAAMLPRYAAALAQGQAAAGSAGSSSPFLHAQAPELLGEWTGTLRTYQGTVPLTLVFQQDGDVHVRLGEQLRTLLNDVVLREGNLVGRFAGDIPTEDTGRHRHTVLLNLRLRPDGRLSGQATALTPPDPLYFALSSYVELRKVSGSP